MYPDRDALASDDQHFGLEIQRHWQTVWNCFHWKVSHNVSGRVKKRAVMGSDFVKCFSGGAIAFQGRSFNDGAQLSKSCNAFIIGLQRN